MRGLIMDEKQIINDFSTKLSKNKEHFIDDLRSLRTGRAHSSMLDGIMVEAYGSTMPLIQVATITVPESQLIQITPFDGSNIQAIVSAIRDNQSLGLNPTDDGRVVRVPIPALNAERRQQIVKQLNEKFEDAMIGMRNSRHETLKEADKLKSDKKIGEDDHKRITKKVDELMNDQKVEIEKLAKAKEHDIVTV
jgi:ribosome recycling factor